jgi:hypothetical protein
VLYGRKDIDRKIVDLQRSLETTDEPLAIALIKLAIESLESERNSLPQTTEEPRE